MSEDIHKDISIKIDDLLFSIQTHTSELYVYFYCILVLLRPGASIPIILLLLLEFVSEYENMNCAKNIQNIVYDLISNSERFYMYLFIYFLFNGNPVEEILIYAIATYSTFFLFHNIQIKKRLHESKFSFKNEMIIDNTFRYSTIERHNQLKEFFEEEIYLLAKKHNFHELSIHLVDSTEDYISCNLKDKKEYHLEFSILSLKNIGVYKGNKLNKSAKKQLRAIIAHEYGHFYHNDCLSGDYADCITLISVVALFSVGEYIMFPIPYILNSLFSKYCEYRADQFSWEYCPKDAMFEFSKYSLDSYSELPLKNKIKEYLFSTHPFSFQRIARLKHFERSRSFRSN